MTIAEYMEYEAQLKTKSRRSARVSHLKKYEGIDLESSLNKKNIVLDYPHYSYDAKIDTYYDLPPLLPCFQPIQPHINYDHKPPYMGVKSIMDNMEEGTNKVPRPPVSECREIYNDSPTELHKASSMANVENTQDKKDVSLKILPCQLPPKELYPGSFTLPCTIRSLNFYVVTYQGASVNVIPKSMFEFLKLTHLKKIDMLVEMVDMMKKSHVGIVENVLVKIDKFLFPPDFVVIDMLVEHNKTMILGRPFLATIHAEINIFNKEISLGVIDCFEAELGPTKDPRARSFDDYKWVFDLEIDQLANEYELGIGKKDIFWRKFEKIERKFKEMTHIGGSFSKEVEFEKNFLRWDSLLLGLFVSCCFGLSDMLHRGPKQGLVNGVISIRLPKGREQRLDKFRDGSDVMRLKSFQLVIVIPNINTSERPPVTTTVFAVTTPENKPFAYRASTSANPNLMISLTFIEANYEVLESLLRERQRPIRNEDLQTELEYFSEDYDKEQELEPKPRPTGETTPPLRSRSPCVRRQRKRVVGFEKAPSREGSRAGRNAEGSMPLEIKAKENGNRGMNFPPLLGAHLGRNESGQPLQSYLTFIYGGHQPSTNIGGISLLTDLLMGNLRVSLSRLRMVTPQLSEPPPIIHKGAVHNIKQREVESTRAFATRYTDDTLQILSLHEDQHISSFVHGLRKKSLVEHLSTDLPSTYKGLMEKTYTWIEAREVATNEAPNDQRENFKRSKKSSWDNNRGQKSKDRFSPYRGPNHGLLSSMCKSTREILATEKIARSFEQPPPFPPCERNKEKAKSSKNRVEGKKDKGATPAKAPILMIRQKESYIRDNVSEDFISGGKEITFPSVTRGSNSSAPVDSNAENRNRSFHHPRSHQIPHVKGIKTVFSTHESDKIKEGTKKLPKHFKERLRDLLRSNADVFAWTHADIKRIPKTIMIEGKPFKIEHKLNEYSHIKPIKQKRRGLGPDHSTSACKEVEELTKAGILRKVKHQTWVANPVMVKKSDEGWRMCINLTDINKACPKDCYPLPEFGWKVESLSWFRLKCILDTYKGYHQIQMAEGGEDKTACFTGEGVFCYQKIRFHLKNAGATYQRLVDKVFYDQIGRNLEAYVDNMVIKSTFEEDMLADIKETLEKFRSINMKLNQKSAFSSLKRARF
ncbi:reverse transcriptase domain-containing protein [Tanacetum coccineum]|uniref:Reverse transcriptase domain-containing protein n=1 Tax=Tanacetum coccineum TaxID=301880 RepID=A0ABQ5AEE4_9ASTR